LGEKEELGQGGKIPKKSTGQPEPKRKKYETRKRIKWHPQETP